MALRHLRPRRCSHPTRRLGLPHGHGHEVERWVSLNLPGGRAGGVEHINRLGSGETSHLIWCAPDDQVSVVGFLLHPRRRPRINHEATVPIRITVSMTPILEIDRSVEPGQYLR